MVNATVMEKGHISAYEAAKRLNDKLEPMGLKRMTINTIIKWVGNGKLKGVIKTFESHKYYEIDERDFNKKSPLIIEAKKDGKEGVSLL